MLRRKRRQSTHLLRAGQRANVFQSDEPAPFVRFRAQVLQGEPAGRIDYETGDPANPQKHAADLGVENLFEGVGVLKISVVPTHDTAITFQPPEQGGSFFYLLVGFLFVLGATVWTARDFLGL